MCVFVSLRAKLHRRPPTRLGCCVGIEFAGRVKLLDAMSRVVFSKDSARFLIESTEIFGHPMHVAFTDHKVVFYDRSDLCWLVAGTHTSYEQKDREPSRVFANVFGLHGRDQPNREVCEHHVWRAYVACAALATQNESPCRISNAHQLRILRTHLLHDHRGGRGRARRQT